MYTFLAVNYYTLDNLGTPRVITNNEEAVISRHDYLPFGEEISSGVDGRSVQRYAVEIGSNQQLILIGVQRP